MEHCGGSGPAGNVQIVSPPFLRKRTVALVGPPNSGKSTLFNRLTGLRQKIANYPGVTVEHHLGQMQLSGGGVVELIDLPGIYSMEPRSEDERITRDVLLGAMNGTPKPDAVLLILDATNLGRHLMLAAPILDIGLPTLIVLNMADDLARRGGEIDTQELAGKLGAPVVLASAAKGQGIEPIQEFLRGDLGLPKPVELPVLNSVPACRAWAARVSSGSYHAPAPPLWSRRLDAVFLHPLWGPLVFLVVLVAVFQTIFSVAPPIGDALEAAINAGGTWIATHLPEGPLRGLITEGVIGGVGSVLVFLPQILVLFLFVGLLEDSGYLARAALIADRTMARAGLQGKSFIPLLSAYACAVPAIMATRTIENKRDRIATILIAPFMTCSARLQVYTLIISAFIPDRQLLGRFFGTRAAALFGLYLLGFVAAVLTARLLKSSILRSDRTPFVMELPAYRWPTFESLGLRLLDRAKAFLFRAGTVILAISVALWVLAHVPTHEGKAPEIRDSVAGAIGRAVEPIISPLGFNWKIGVGLITSLAAREVVIGTLGTLYGIENANQESVGLQKALQADLSMGGAVALLIFFAFAMQCMSTVAVVRRETGGWRWPAIQFAYMTGLAYVCAFVANRIFA
ncbi:MAG: ferrous iron transport protein B [Bryobacteraceae bacterium]